jgi:hypothetical protein
LPILISAKAGQYITSYDLNLGGHMKSAILLQFHRNVPACLDRVSLLRNQNPGVPIFGLYGGTDWEHQKFRRHFSPVIDHFYFLRGKRPRWKWQNPDLCVRSWFKAVGKNFKFDVLYALQWDLLVATHINEAFKRVPQEAIGLTGLVPFHEVKDRWGWCTAATVREPGRNGSWWNPQYAQLLAHLKKRFGYTHAPYVIHGPGQQLSRAFLETYAEERVLELCHDEARLPAYVDAFGFKLVDNGFCRKWFNKAEWQYFNCEQKEIADGIIHQELKKKNGRRVFHPVRRVVGLADLKAT